MLAFYTADISLMGCFTLTLVFETQIYAEKLMFKLKLNDIVIPTK